MTPDIEGKVRLTSAITCLLLGPIDLGNKMLAKEGILEMMLVMANTDDLLQQVRVGSRCDLFTEASKFNEVKGFARELSGLVIRAH